MTINHFCRLVRKLERLWFANSLNWFRLNDLSTMLVVQTAGNSSHCLVSRVLVGGGRGVLGLGVLPRDL